MPSLLVMALLLIRGPRMLTAIANNGATVALVREWQGVIPSQGLPRCETQLETSVAERYLVPAMIWGVESRSTLLNRGRIAWIEGKCSEAKEIWEQVTRLWPTDSVSAFWRFWLDGGRPEVLSEAIGAEQLARYADTSGQQAEREGATDAAISWLELSLSLEPTRGVAGRLATLHREVGRPQDADAVLERLIGELTVEDADYWWALGQVAELDGQWGKAAQAYSRGAELEEAPYEFRLSEAAALEKLEDWDAAKTAYRAALEARPDLMWPYLRLGHLQRRAGDIEGALARYRQAQAADPDSTLPSFYTGVLFFDHGAVSEAQGYFEKALGIDSSHVESVYYLSQSLYRRGQARDAVNLLAQAVAMQGGQRWRWAVELGDWRLALGNVEGALAAYRQALEWNPEEGSILRRLEHLQGSED
jgi:tetratricopeptide (TPR) repeat protein